VRRLRKQQVFGVLIDQDTKVEGVFAHFLGRLAYTPSGPVKLGRKLDVPICVATTVRTPDQRHRIEVHGPLHFASGADETRQIVEGVEEVNRIFSEQIRAHPDQWVWMHRRWRRSPADEHLRHVASIHNYITDHDCCSETR
jgi:KDO2-lipid IV(A) lauroyltransferase